MNEIELIDRTKQFALRVLKLAEALPKTMAGNTVGGQIIRSATSVAANYRAACKARSKAEFISKLGIVEEESDESIFWLEMIIESGMLKKSLVGSLHKEAEEITAVIAASRRTAKRNLDK